MTDKTQTTEPPWWAGTVIPTGRYRLKMRDVPLPGGAGCITMPMLQHLVRSAYGIDGRWLDVQLVERGESDDER
jgi:hypothetical protein